MMEKDLFRGELVRLAVDEPQTVAESFSRWVARFGVLAAGELQSSARLFIQGD